MLDVLGLAELQHGGYHFELVVAGDQIIPVFSHDDVVLRRVLLVGVLDDVVLDEGRIVGVFHFFVRQLFNLSDSLDTLQPVVLHVPIVVIPAAERDERAVFGPAVFFTFPVGVCVRMAEAVNGDDKIVVDGFPGRHGFVCIRRQAQKFRRRAGVQSNIGAGIVRDADARINRHIIMAVYRHLIAEVLDLYLAAVFCKLRNETGQKLLRVVPLQALDTVGNVEPHGDVFAVTNPKAAL